MRSAPSPEFASEADRWQQLIDGWAAYDLEVLPYRQGPDVRPGGLVDPGLLMALAAVTRASNGSIPTSAFKSCVDRGRRHEGEGAQKGGQDQNLPFCCENDKEEIECRWRGVKGGGQHTGVVVVREGSTWGTAPAQVVAAYVYGVIVRRCRELLVALPSSAMFDRSLLQKLGSASKGKDVSMCAYGGKKLTEEVALAIRYRLLKKEMLLNVIHQLDT